MKLALNIQKVINLIAFAFIMTTLVGSVQAMERDKREEKPLTRAASKFSFDLCQLPYITLRYFFYCASPLLRLLFAEEKSVKRYSLIDNRNIPLNKVDADGNTALHTMILRDGVDAVSAVELVSETLDINAQNNRGETALHLALRKNRPVIAAALISQGADLTIQSKKGVRPFHIPHSFCGLLEHCVQTGVDLTEKTAEGFGALYYNILHANKVGNIFNDNIRLLIRHAIEDCSGLYELTASIRFDIDDFQKYIFFTKEEKRYFDIDCFQEYIDSILNAKEEKLYEVNLILAAAKGQKKVVSGIISLLRS